MKKFVFLFVIFSLTLFSIFPKEIPSNYIEGYTGLTFGKIGEFLYVNNTSKELTSLLEWEELPLINAGLSFGMPIKHIQIDGRFSFQIPYWCGHMYDSDWASDVKVDYAKFDLYNNSGFSAEVSATYNFSITKKLSFAPSVSFLYEYNSFSGKNGIAWKGDSEHTTNHTNVPWNSPEAKEIKVYGIDYWQHFSSLYTGFSMSYTYRKWNFTEALSISPYTLVYACDVHEDRSKGGEDFYYYMLFKGFFQNIKNSFSVLYKLSDFMDIHSALTFTLTPQVRGRGNFPHNGTVLGTQTIKADFILGCKINL